MKKSAFLTTFLFFYSFLVLQAQFHFEVEAGASYNKPRQYTVAKEFLGTQALMGYFASIAPHYALNKNWSVSLPMQYAQEKFSEKVFVQGNHGSLDYKYGQIRVMPTLQYKITHHFIALTGVHIAWKLNEWTRETNTSGDWLKSSGSYESLEKSHFGAQAGVQYFHKKAFVKLQYIAGISPMRSLQLTDDSGLEIGDLNEYTSTLQLGLGYRIR